MTKTLDAIGGFTFKTEAQVQRNDRKEACSYQYLFFAQFQIKQILIQDFACETHFFKDRRNAFFFKFAEGLLRIHWSQFQIVNDRAYLIRCAGQEALKFKSPYPLVYQFLVFVHEKNGNRLNGQISGCLLCEDKIFLLYENKGKD